MNAIKAVIFDLDNTLFDETEYFIQIFTKFKATRKHLGLIKFFFDQGLRNSSSDVFRDILELLNVYSNNLHEDLFYEYKNANFNLQLDNDTLKTFSFLRTKNIKIGVLTNGVVEAQKNKVKLLGLNDLVDIIVYAREIGKEKPDANSFLFACNKLKIKAEKCIFIGDNIVNDVNGAMNAGLKAALTEKYSLDAKKNKEQYILFDQVSELVL